MTIPWYEVCVVRRRRHLDNTVADTLDAARSAVRRFDLLYDRVLIVVRRHLRGTRRFRVLRSLTLDKRLDGKAE